MDKLHNSINYKWVIVGLCFLMVFTGLGFASSTKSLYITAITDALDISRTAFSLNDTMRYVSTAIVNIFFGSLIVRFGSKKLILAGFFFLALSCVVYAVSTNILMFYLGGAFLGIGLSWTTTTMVSSVINRWCKENKGTVMGAVLAANGIGGAVATQIVTPIIYKDGDAFGYRKAYILTAIIFVAVMAVILVLYKEKAEPIKNEKPKKNNNDAELLEGDDFKKIVRNKYFYVLVVCIFITGTVIQGITGIATPHLQDVGLDIGFISIILSLHWIMLTVTKFLTGFIYDRAGLKVSMNICMTAALIVLFTLPLVTNSFGGKILATLYEIMAPMALPLETIMLPIYAGDLFGQRSFDKVLGVFVSVNTAGYAVGAPLANLCFDVFGSYKIALISAGIIMSVVVVAMQVTVYKLKSK